MPVLAAYIGYSGVSVALEKPDGSFAFDRFPYIYSDELFSSVCDEKTFYKQVLDAIAKENKAKLSDFEVLLTGFMEIPLLDVDVKMVADVQSLLPKHDSDHVVLIDESTILTKDALLSEVPVNFIANNEFYANLSIYPQLITRDYSDQVNLDGLIIEKVRRGNMGINSEKPILFTGDRFARRDYEPVFKYALALDLFNSPGCYYVKIDTANSVLLGALINEYRPGQAVDCSGVIESVGTFVISPGQTEVLISSDFDTGQFFDLKSDTVFVLPLDPETLAKMSLKNKVVGNLEGKVEGGRLGLLFDTRFQRKQLISDPKVLNAFMKEVEEAVKGI